MFRFGIILLTLLLSHGVATANNLPFDRYIHNIYPTAYQGGSQVWSIESSGDGYQFFAAGTQLVVWDGSVWCSYDLNKTSVLRALCYNREEGRLYCAGDNIFGYWELNRYGDWIFNPLYCNNDLSRNKIFWRIVEKDDFVYFQTHSEIICYHKPSSGIQTLKGGNDIDYILSSEGQVYAQIDSRVVQINQDQLEDIGIKTSDRILWIEPRQESFVTISEQSGFRLWRDGVESNLFDRTNSLLSKLKIFSARRLKSGGWLVGTILDGAYIISEQGDIVESFNEAAGLKYSTALCLGEDDNNNIWLGLDGGIAYIAHNSDQLYYKSHNQKIGYVYSVIMHNGKLMLGTNKGLYQVDKSGDAMLLDGMEGQVWGMMLCGDNLVVTHNKGLYQIDRTGSCALIINGVWKFEPWPGEPNIYMASDKSGLILFELDGRGDLKIKHRIDNYEGYINNSIKIDKFGNVWIDELYGSVRRLVLDKDRHKVIRSSTYMVGERSDCLVVGYQLDGEVIFSNGESCFRYNVACDTFELDQYYTNIVSMIALPHVNLLQMGNRFLSYSGNKFVTILRDVDVFTKNIVRSYIEDTGSIPSRYHKLCPINDSLVAIGFDDAVVAYNISHKERAEVQKIRLRQVEYDLYGVAQKLDVATVSTVIELPNSASNIKLYFLGMSATAVLQYSLDDKEWQIASRGQALTISYLNSGEHLLRIQVGNSSVVHEIKVTIKPHFTQAWWFILLMLTVGVGIALLGCVLYKKRMKSVKSRYTKRQNELLEQGRMKYENEMLQLKVRERDKKLFHIAMNDVNINNMLDRIEEQLKSLKEPISTKDVRQINKSIDGFRRDNESWKVLEAYFNSIHDGFLDRLLAKYPKLTNNDLKICAYIKLGLSTKQIASLMSIEMSSVESARYRLRKNMGLPANVSLSETISQV